MTDTTKALNLPPLPEPSRTGWPGIRYYSDDQMRKYALAAIAARSAPAAQEVSDEKWECAQVDAFNKWMLTASSNINQFSALAGWMACARALLAAAPKVPDDLRRAGSKMANVLFNLAQNKGRALTQDECDLLKKLQREWDDALSTATSAPQAEGNGWQPIETAPKDGARMLAYVEWRDGPAIEVGEFKDGEFYPNHRDYASIDPTHWQSLPPAPIAAAPMPKQEG